MKSTRVTNPNAVTNIQLIGLLILLLVTLVVGFALVQPYTMRGDDYGDVLGYTYLAAAPLLLLCWVQSCGWWRQSLINKELRAKNNELRETYRYALPTKLALALFLAMDTVRDQTGREGWGVANNPTLVDVRTWSAWLDKLVQSHGTQFIIELAREGKAPFVLDHILADKRTAIESLLRDSVSTNTM